MTPLISYREEETPERFLLSIAQLPVYWLILHVHSVAGRGIPLCRIGGVQKTTLNSSPLANGCILAEGTTLAAYAQNTIENTGQRGHCGHFRREVTTADNAGHIEYNLAVCWSLSKQGIKDF